MDALSASYELVPQDKKYFLHTVAFGFVESWSSKLGLVVYLYNTNKRKEAVSFSIYFTS